MRLILVGCEYAGKTTLANEIVEWTKRTMGGGRSFHDHFTIPNPEMSMESRKQYMAATAQIKEMYQRFMMAHHLSPEFYRGPDHNLVGFHIEEAVYAPLFYGYGGTESQAPGRSSEGQRSRYARQVEKEILDIAPDTVMVLLEASVEVIARRMKGSSHEHQVVKEEDIEHVTERFREEYEASLIHKSFVLDTTSAKVDETLAEFAEQIEPHLTQADRTRVLTHQALS